MFLFFRVQESTLQQHFVAFELSGNKLTQMSNAIVPVEGFYILQSQKHHRIAPLVGGVLFPGPFDIEPSEEFGATGHVPVEEGP